MDFAKKKHPSTLRGEKSAKSLQPPQMTCSRHLSPSCKGPHGFPSISTGLFNVGAESFSHISLSLSLNELLRMPEIPSGPIRAFELRRLAHIEGFTGLGFPLWRAFLFVRIH